MRREPASRPNLDAAVWRGPLQPFVLSAVGVQTALLLGLFAAAAMLFG